MAELVKGHPTVIEVSVEDLLAAPWNYKVSGTKAELAKLRASIESSKSAGILCVRELKLKKGSRQLYEVLDGNHRLQAIKDAGWKTVKVENFGQLTQSQAIILSRQRNYQWFADDDVKLGKLYAEDLLVDFEKDDLISVLPDAVEEFDKLYMIGQGIDPGATDEDKPRTSNSIRLTEDQWAVVSDAIERVRESEGSKEMSEGRAIELICGDYLAGS